MSTHTPGGHSLARPDPRSGRGRSVIRRGRPAFVRAASSALMTLALGLSGCGPEAREEFPGGRERRDGTSYAVSAAVRAANSPPATPDTVRVEERTLEVDGRTFGYLVQIPASARDEDTAPVEGWPMVLGLHGAGSRGTAGEQGSQSLAEAARRDPAGWPVVMVLPQVPRGTSWADPLGIAIATAALDSVTRGFPVDRDALHLAGQSMGGEGVLHLARHLDGVRAVVAVAASGRGLPAGGIPAEVAVLLHHGTEDRIPVSAARERRQEMVAAGSACVLLIEHPGRGHDIFDDVYADPATREWLLYASRRQCGEG